MDWPNSYFSNLTRSKAPWFLADDRVGSFFRLFKTVTNQELVLGEAVEIDCNYSLYLLGRKFVMMGEYLNDPTASATFFEETCAKWELAFFQQVLRALRDSSNHLNPLVPACLKCRDSVDHLASQFQWCRLSAASEVIENMQNPDSQEDGVPEWDSRVHVVDFVGAVKLWLFFLGVDLLLLNEQEEALSKKNHTAADEKRESLK